MNPSTNPLVQMGGDGAVPYLAVGATDTPGHWPILSVGRPTALCRWRGNGGSGAVRSGKGGLVSCDTIRLFSKYFLGDGQR